MILFKLLLLYPFQRTQGLLYCFPKFIGWAYDMNGVAFESSFEMENVPTFWLGATQATVQPRFKEPLNNEVLGITNDFLQHGQKME